MSQPNSNLSVNKFIFYPSIILLTIIVGYSIIENEVFIDTAESINAAILNSIGGVFTWSAFIFLIILTIIYFSPLGKVKIGGDTAEPLLSKWQWFSIALCTTVATGILFWGCAEPLYHLYEPPGGLGLEPGSTEAAHFAMSTMFMHWAFTPYGIYTVAGLSFALMYYNYNQSFSVGSLVHPILGKYKVKSINTIIDIACLVALVCGMSASLGTGIFALMGGLETTTGLLQTDLLMAIIGIAIVGTFIISAASGLKKGIAVLSKWNARAFIAIAVLIFILGPTAYMIETVFGGLVDYTTTFVSRSTNIGSSIDAGWLGDWTIFYFANWYAWAPIAALFLGRIAMGYTIREFIQFNLLWPSIFTCFWMMIFSGIAMEVDAATDGSLYALMQDRGEENVMFAVFETLPGGQLISYVILIVVFVSYVTAADSNISAMSGMSTNSISPDQPEAPIWIKIVWGLLIGVMTFVMITSAGIDGVRMLSIMGGTIALLIIILAGVGLVKLLYQSFNQSNP